jgi:hypothetical protein
MRRRDALKTIPRNTLLLAFLFVPLIVCAEVVPPDAAAVDQVVIKAEREKLVKLQKEVQLSEQRFYTRYNQVNTKRDYAVKCVNEADTGTRFKRSYCQPVFANKAQEEQARRAFQYLGSSSTPSSTSSAAYGMHAGAMTGITGMGGTNSGEDQVSLAQSSSTVTGDPAIIAVEGSQADFQNNMIELTRKNPELTKLLNEHIELVKEYEATLRKVNGAEPKDAQKAPAPAANPQ